MISARLWLSAAAALTLLSACVPLLPHTKFEPPDAPSFPGIRQAVDEAVEPPGHVWLVVVHGMGTHEPGYSRDFRTLLAGELSFTQTGDCDTLPVPDTGRDAGVVLLACGYGPRGSSARLVVYELTWSHLTELFKATFLARDSSGPPAKDRVWLNREMKKNLVNSSLSDAVLYLGKMRQKILNSVRSAIDQIVRHQKTFKNDPGRHRLFLVANSLGSQIVFEALQVMKKSPRPTELEAGAQDFTNAVNAVYMLANPLPLLCLHDLEHPLKGRPDLPGTCRWLDEFGKTFKLQERKPPIPIVTFSDPNDLLSYPTSGGAPGDPRFKFVSVQLRIAKWAYLGVAADPWTAHTGYWTNREVVRLIACGHGSESRCQQER